MTDTLHHRYRGEDLDRYRIALYAQAMAARDGLAIPDALLHPDDIEIEWTEDNRPRAVIIRRDSFELRVIVASTATATTTAQEDR
jgi:hypothetical protein